MNMKKLTTLTLAALATSAVLAAPKAKKTAQAMAGNDDGPETTGRAAKILIDQAPRLGQQNLQFAPNINGQQMFFKKPRKWIVLNMAYTTFGTDTSKFLDQLTFTWHVLLDTKTATENKGNKERIAPYSYFTTTTTYFNIPAGTHGASVCLPPSYLERYGEPKAIGVEVSNENGDVLVKGSVSDVRGIAPNTDFWADTRIMDAKGSDGKPMIERRQGLVDRSKTIWALVYPNDYESTIQ